MLASSVELGRCRDSVTDAVAAPIIDGTKELQAVAIPTRVGCQCCAHSHACVTRWVSSPIVPVDAATAVVLRLRATPSGRNRLRRELPAAIHRMTSVGEWQHVAALCRRFPLGVAPVVANTDDWGGDAVVVPLQALHDFAVAGVLGVATAEKAIPTATSGRLTCTQAVQAYRVKLYHQCLLRSAPSRKTLARIITACIDLPAEVSDMIATAATAQSLRPKTSDCAPRTQRESTPE